MKATEAKFLDFLKKSPQFVIPIYQRAYSWTERECAQLWGDIIRTGSNADLPAHFVGSIVYVEAGLYQVSNRSPMLVIDGQQRLTTIMLLIEALARSLGDKEPVDGFSAKKLRNYYLLNDLESDERRYKLILSETDKTSLIALLDQEPQPKPHSIRIAKNFQLFREWIRDAGDQQAVICSGLAKLAIVDISLNRDQDNPQLIFESLNSTGRELTQADLIRNFVLMGLEPEHQARLYRQHWRPMEIEFGQDAYAAEFDSFMRHYLTVRTGQIPNVREVYDSFKAYARASARDFDDIVADIHRLAGYFCALVLGREPDKELETAFHDIRDLKVDVATPLLLELYADYKADTLGKSDLLDCVRLVESYVFRRAVCSIPTNSMNKTFATFAKGIRKPRYVESLSAQFMSLPSYRRFPRDDEFSRDLKTRDLYNFRSRTYWLRRIENYDRKERVAVEEYTIEHILPQNEKLDEKWKQDIGPDWRHVQETYLHTLGNLTLTAYNSEYSDEPFVRKRDMKGGFAVSPLRLNEGLGQLTKWDEQAIRNRAEQLATVAIQVWASPDVPASAVAEFKAKPLQAAYTIANHPHLAAGAMQTVFEALRVQIVAIDESVVEEFLKLYVAYKAETNFVDVIPQAKRLILSLNIGIHEIDDPKAMCVDVSQKGRWGNGDVEAAVSTLEELPYAVGLIRQAFEKQIDPDPQ